MPGRSKYPWATWTNGDEWRVYKGEDYTLSTMNFQISVHGRAKTGGLRVITRSFRKREPDENGLMRVREGLIFQFYQEGT